MVSYKEYNVIVLNEAEEELRSIYRYFAQDLYSPETAEKQRRMLENALLSLKRFPLRHRRYIGEYRRLNVGSYAVLYTVENDIVLICGIFHQSMNIRKQLL